MVSHLSFSKYNVRMGHLKHSGLDWMVRMLIAKLTVFIYTQIKFNLTLRFSCIRVICITLHITVQWQAIINTDNSEGNNNNNNILSQEKTSEQSYTNWIINQSLRGQLIKE